MANKNIEAVIEIGSTGLRLLVVEFIDDNKWNTLDRSEMPVAIGKDVFTTGSVQRNTLVQCLHILSRFKEQIAAWGLTTHDVSVIATSALREARDRDSIIDRIFVKTGFHVRIIDGIEENRLMYVAVKSCLELDSKNLGNRDSVILEVGGSSTEMMLIKKGSMAGAHSLRLGTTRIEQHIPHLVASNDNAYRYIQQFILNAKATLNDELNLARVQQFIAVGQEAQIAAINYGKPIGTFLWEISREEFERFYNDIKDYSVEECIARFKISYNDAQQLNLGLLIYKMFVDLTNVKKIIVPETNIRDGLIISKRAAPDAMLQQDFYSQITASAKNLLRKFHGDEEHANYVAKVSLMLFDALKDEIVLDERARMLLEVSALLHDIGMFIRMENHHLHSAYIISNSEIFGLQNTEITIITEIAKYHRGSAMPENEDQFQMLPRLHRMTVLKLTAILRIADALDRAHTQKFTDFTITRQNDNLILRTQSQHNMVLEKQALLEKGGMFEAVFGYKIILA